ncbi:MAG TPA: hypothetical protein VN200_10640 [Rhodoglobus sp.]|nr:hypothetical protein [Rhodoglobus sp.]
MTAPHRWGTPHGGEQRQALALAAIAAAFAVISGTALVSGWFMA